jgi:hypothetical protein
VLIKWLRVGTTFSIESDTSLLEDEFPYLSYPQSVGSVTNTTLGKEKGDLKNTSAQ